MMYYDERCVDGNWQYRTSPNGEWRDGRVQELSSIPATPAALPELPELLPCAHCGRKPRLENLVLEAAVSCEGCGATIVRQHAIHEDTGSVQAAQAWNRRWAAPAADRQIVCNRDCDCVGECKAGLEKLNTRPLAPSGGAVAWRFRRDGRWSGWALVSGSSLAETVKAAGWEIEYAYTTPPPNPEVRALVTALARVREIAEGWNEEAKAEGFGGGNTRAKEVLEALNDLERGK